MVVAVEMDRGGWISGIFWKLNWPDLWWIECGWGWVRGSDKDEQIKWELAVENEPGSGGCFLSPTVTVILGWGHHYKDNFGQWHRWVESAVKSELVRNTIETRVCICVFKYLQFYLIQSESLFCSSIADVVSLVCSNKLMKSLFQGI